MGRLPRKVNKTLPPAVVIATVSRRELKRSRGKEARKIKGQKKRDEDMFLLESIKLAKQEKKCGMVMELAEEFRGGG